MEEKKVGSYSIKLKDSGIVVIRPSDSIGSLKIHPLSSGKIDVEVEGAKSAAFIGISREALDAALDMLDGKSDVVSPEAEADSGIPECEFMLSDENSDLPSCRAQRPNENGKHPVCSEKTRHPYLDCQEIHRNFGTHQPEKSGE